MAYRARIKKWGKRLLKVVAVILAPVLLYLLAGLILSLAATRPEKQNCSQKHTIYIGTNGVHLDIILPRELLGDSLSGALLSPTDIRYLAFGWGDKGFYLETPTWAELEVSVALEALFWKSGTAMHLTHYRRQYGSWRLIDLCPDQLQRLQTYIWHGFAKDGEGRLIEIPRAGYTRMDHFFEAVGHYSCLKTCNNWVNIGLKRAGLKTAVWSPFDLGVLYHLPRQNE
ncbi:TIGR02117 family protein [Flavilitoribacter nigricans]|uniref:TIGR02117 family protein n=1 Tax=Flavilitoribacter nigricans (strain ATCC 23147 / DSM 23189 / NBRC 102662 / NCIMB 1420 / SS-2) TaxID=1122177 RepID=A0A2D0N4F4_FLAN2|nr:TIGR02117 family protein [Flavilitoribacter nigricans]PHN03268.1 TIGR02117 family protein [Flavilitoribacter nigricans DSM 23189 = NBRC 102662]